MSKAILVIDMPDSCDVCEFTDMANGKIYCGVPGGGEPADDYIACRPDWCPLRELPEKMKVCGRYPQKDGITPSYKIGWNDCIDAILKGEEHE